MGYRSSLYREIVLVWRYGAVGIFSTALHISIATAIIWFEITTPLGANTIAFSVAFIFSFFGNYIWTYSKPGKPFTAIKRYLFISIAGFFANTATLMAITKTALFSPNTSIILSALTVPAISYVASRHWAFVSKKANREND